MIINAIFAHFERKDSERASEKNIKRKSDLKTHLYSLFIIKGTILFIELLHVWMLF